MAKMYTVDDFDGMGGHETDYHCGECNKMVARKDKFCKHCGVEFTEFEDTQFIGNPNTRII